jgi:hypothetical protein
MICPTGKAENFLQKGWTDFGDLPVGLFCRSAAWRSCLHGKRSSAQFEDARATALEHMQQRALHGKPYSGER